jgi:hypothetical protein
MAADEANAGGGKMFSEDTVAVLLMALGSVSISTAQYAMMSSLDGTKTASSFQHSFRSVLKKAKELKARADNGEAFEPVAPAKKRGTYRSMRFRYAKVSANTRRRCGRRCDASHNSQKVQDQPQEHA